jgi:hypothetical protein
MKLNRAQKMWLAVALVAIATHQAYMYRQVLPLIDEVYSWLFFGGKGFWVSLTNYSTTNNHILYNLCTAFWATFVPDTVLATRLTSIVSFWVLLSYIFLYLYQKTNFNIAFWAVCLVGLGFSQAVFSVQGRGYMLMALCAFGAVCSAIEYIEKPQNKHLAYFAGWNVAGLFASPVFVCTTVGVYGFWVWQARKIQNVRKIVLVTVAISLATFLLYLPMLLVFGLEGFLASQKDNLRPTNFGLFLTYILPICLRESVQYLMGLPKYTSFIAFSIFIVLLSVFYTKLHAVGKTWVVYLLASFMFTLAFIVVGKTFPLYRIWTYYAVLGAVAVAFLIDALLPKPHAWVQGTLFLGLVVGSFAQFEYARQDFYDRDTIANCEKLRDKFLQIAEKNVLVYLSEDAFYGIFWFRQVGKAHLLVGKSCEARIGVSAHNKPLPTCLQKQERIWFLDFYAISPF